MWLSKEFLNVNQLTLCSLIEELDRNVKSTCGLQCSWIQKNVFSEYKKITIIIITCPFKLPEQTWQPIIKLPLTKSKRGRSQTSTVTDTETEEQREQQATGCTWTSCRNLSGFISAGWGSEVSDHRWDKQRSAERTSVQSRPETCGLTQTVVLFYAFLLELF